MLTALQSMDEIHEGIKDLDLDWSQAMGIVRNVAGSNVSAGLTKGSNWLIPFINALSNNQIPKDRILITPYAKVMPEVGMNPLPETVYQYYAYAVWGSIYNRCKISKAVFTDLETIYLPGRATIPGDYEYSNASNVTDFMVRLKYSLQEPGEMLSNTVGFWMSGELQKKQWISSHVDLPGLTTGFPKDIEGYPPQSPVIAGE